MHAASGGLIFILAFVAENGGPFDGIHTALQSALSRNTLGLEWSWNRKKQQEFGLPSRFGGSGSLLVFVNFPTKKICCWTKKSPQNRPIVDTWKLNSGSFFFHHVAPTKKMGFYNLAGYPKIDGFERNILLKWMIWRYPHSGNLHIMVNIYISKKQWLIYLHPLSLSLYSHDHDSDNHWNGPNPDPNDINIPFPIAISPLDIIVIPMYIYIW